MILKLGMKHQAMVLYKVCINHDPGMTLTFFTARLPTHLNGENFYKLANGLNLYDLKKKLTPEVALGLYTCILPF